jgi:hypothetical protein
MAEQNSVDVGPFTPQELDQVCEHLKKSGVAFEVLKDEETERLEMRPDFVNVVNKVEYRTETYLAQIYYLRLNRPDFEKRKNLFSRYGMGVANSDNPDELLTDMSGTHEKAKASARFRHVVAWVLLAQLLLGFIWIIKDLFF